MRAHTHTATTPAVLYETVWIRILERSKIRLNTGPVPPMMGKGLLTQRTALRAWSETRFPGRSPREMAGSAQPVHIASPDKQPLSVKVLEL